MSTVKLGYVWSGVSPAVDNSADELAADATVKWINEYGGGLAGHPVQIVKCPTNSDVSIAAACATTLIEAKVQAVLFNVVGEIAPWATPVEKAGIPIIGFSSADASLLPASSKGTAADNAPIFILSNPTSGIAAFPAALAKDKGAKNSVIDVIDVPGATGPAQALGPALFKAAGAGNVTVVPISPTAPDHGPAIQAALKNSPDLWHIIGNPAYCTLSIKGLLDANYKGIISGIGNCIDAASRKALGDKWKGIVLSYAWGEDVANKDYIQFQAILDKFAAKKTEPHGTSVGAYVVWEGLHRFLAANPPSGDITSDAIIKSMRAGSKIPMPTIDGPTYTCDGKAVPGVPIACTAGFTSATMGADGLAATWKGFAG
jgi:branched-chain amino acid transport system substrate-binding protein